MPTTTQPGTTLQNAWTQGSTKRKESSSDDTVSTATGTLTSDPRLEEILTRLAKMEQGLKVNQQSIQKVSKDVSQLTDIIQKQSDTVALLAQQQTTTSQNVNKLTENINKLVGHQVQQQQQTEQLEQHIAQLNTSMQAHRQNINNQMAVIAHHATKDVQLSEGEIHAIQSIYEEDIIMPDSNQKTTPKSEWKHVNSPSRKQQTQSTDTMSATPASMTFTPDSQATPYTNSPKAQYHQDVSPVNLNYNRFQALSDDEDNEPSDETSTQTAPITNGKIANLFNQVSTTFHHMSGSNQS